MLGETPVNVQVDGQWKPVDETLAGAGGAGWVNEEHPLAPEFARRSGGEVATVTNDGYTLGWRLLGAADVRGVLPQHRDGTQGDLRYGDVLDGADLVYDVQPAQVKETMVLDEAPKTTTEYRWLLSAPGLSVQSDSVGGFVVLDAAGDVRFTIPAPVMWDSSGVVGEREPESAPVASRVERSGDDWLLTLTPDAQWLAAPERVYPVMVDPSVSWGPTYRWSYKSDGVFANNTNYIGNPWQANHALYWRSYARYPLQNIAGYYVTDSVMELTYTTGTATCQWDIVGYSGTTNPTSVSSYGSDIASFTMCNGYTTASNSSIDGLDSTLASMVRTGNYYNFISFRAHDEANIGYSYKGFNSSILVVYSSYPSVPGVTGATPVSGAVAPRAPKMQAIGHRRQRSSAVPLRVREDKRHSHRHRARSATSPMTRDGLSRASSRSPRTCSSRTPNTATASP